MFRSEQSLLAILMSACRDQDEDGKRVYMVRFKAGTFSLDPINPLQQISRNRLHRIILFISGEDNLP
jgi:hypothetical protein